MGTKKKHRKQKLIFLIGCYFICTYSVFGATKNIVTSVVNELEMGIVDISLKEYTLDEKGNEVVWQDKENVMPGDLVYKIPRIKNEAVECWIRAKIKLESEPGLSNPLSMEQIRGISKEWISVGNYFYYTKTLKAKQSVDLFQAVEIPTQWSKEQEENRIKILVQADAVQAEHFTPDFESDTPWGGLVVEKCIHENGYDVNTFRVEEESSLQVEYLGEAKKLIATPSDFFKGFGSLMPGDTEEEIVEIENKGTVPVNLFFKTEQLEEADLLEKIQLTIRNKADEKEEERVLYEGALNSEKLRDYQLLGCYDPNYKGKFTFILTVPEELNNKYTLEKRKVKWYFMAQELEKTETPEEPDKPNNPDKPTTIVFPPTQKNPSTTKSNATYSNIPDSSNPIREGQQANPVEKRDGETILGTSPNVTKNPYKNGGENGNQSTKPKTGDNTPLRFFLICAVVSMIGIVITTKKLREDK